MPQNACIMVLPFGLFRFCLLSARLYRGFCVLPDFSCPRGSWYRRRQSGLRSPFPRQGAFSSPVRVGRCQHLLPGVLGWGGKGLRSPSCCDSPNGSAWFNFPVFLLRGLGSFPSFALSCHRGFTLQGPGWHRWLQWAAIAERPFFGGCRASGRRCH